MLADKLKQDDAGEASALGVESGDAAVDVVVGLLARGQGEVAGGEGELGEEGEELGLGGGVE